MKTNLLNPTPAQVKYRNRLWVNALLENKRKARKAMHDKEGGRCCLAVAQDVAIACGALDGSLETGDGMFPHSKVKFFFGWGSNNPMLNVKINGKIVEEEAATLNDGNPEFAECKIKDPKMNKKGLSHKQIAECVLNTFVRPSKFKQSFKIKASDS
jgi:hypothetical protein